MTTESVRVNHEEIVEALFQALINDGFKAYCCGPRDNPAAMIASYDWPTCTDVVVVPAQGPAGAARFEGRADVLNPPEKVSWAWVGDPESAIWALLNVAAPDDPDAPAAAVPCPAALRVPRETQRPTTVRLPLPSTAGVRAARLRRMRIIKGMSREFFEGLFGAVDSAAAIGAAENFTDDGVLVFANYPPMVGRTAITQFTMLLFQLAADVQHFIDDFWQVGERAAFTRGRVTFTRSDGSQLTVPFATVSLFNEDRSLLIHHQVYVDASMLRTP